MLFFDPTKVSFEVGKYESINSHDFFFQIHHNVFGSVKLCSLMMWLSFFGGDDGKFPRNCRGY